MATFPFQSSNQYFQPPARFNPSQNLLSGFSMMEEMKKRKAAEGATEAAQQLATKKDARAEAKETTEQEIKEREQATESFNQWATFLPELNEADPQTSLSVLSQEVPKLEKSLTQQFGGNIPESIAPFVQTLKSGDPSTIQRLQQYRKVNNLVPETKYGSPVKAIGPDGKPGFFRINPQTRQAERVEGLSPIQNADRESDLARYIEERDALPPGSPKRALYDARIARLTAPTLQQGQDIDIEAMAEGVADQSIATAQIPKRGAVWSQVVSKVKEKNPKFNLMYNDANYKWFTSARGTATINMLNGSLPRVAALYSQVEELPNSALNSWNSFKRAVVTEAGYQDYSAFEANRNAIVQEVNAAISGTSQASDLRVKIELDNLKSSRSPEQLRAAIMNLYDALTARLDASMAGPFPKEVVNGEMSMDKYRKSITEQYKGNYNRYPERRWKESGGEKQPAETTVDALSNEEILKGLGVE